MGSSPHARGKHVVRTGDQDTHRLIPACAGKTPVISPHLHLWPAHPRMRGENIPVRWLSARPVGSSPHARGKPTANPEHSAQVRLIPACAGKTVRNASRERQLKAHPRMRGENNLTRFIMNHYWGSSPHARGKPLDDPVRAILERLIPACAGKTVEFSSFVEAAEAHPRMRGENDT